MTLDEFREVKRTAEHNNKPYFVNLGFQGNELNSTKYYLERRVHGWQTIIA